MIIRREPKSQSGWNSGDVEVAHQLLGCLVWSGDVCSKSSRNYLVEEGYALYKEGYQTLSLKGIKAFLTHPYALSFMARRWWRIRRSSKEIVRSNPKESHVTQ